MPAQIQYRDQAAVVTPPDGYLQPFPLTLGPTWQQNDVRVLFVSGSEAASGGVSEAVQMNPDPPTGFTQAYALAPDFETRGVYYRRLVTGDTDTSVAWIKPASWRDFMWATLSIRGMSPTVAPVAGDLTQLMTHNVEDDTLTVGSVTVPAAGEMLFCLWLVADPEGNWPSWPAAMGVPTGWKHVSATDKSGNTFFATSIDPSIVVIGKKFAAAGSTGSVSVPVGVGSHAFAGMYLFVQPAADVSTTIGAVSETDTAGAITSSATTLVSSAISPVSEVDTAGPIFTGFGGFGISPPLNLTGLPVTGSVVEFAGTGVFKIETTINGGASWDVVAKSGDSVPRLKPEDVATRSVRMRISATRTLVTDPSPTLTYLRLAVTDDESTIELVPVGHGVVDKVTRRRSSSDSAGGGSGGGPGVVGKGGGQSGGGKSLTVHAVDLSKMVSANPWGSAFVIQTGENYVDAGVRMLLNRLPTQTQFRLCTTTKVTTEPYIYGLNQGTDPYKDLKEFLLPAGLEPYFDAAGVFVIRQIPDPAAGVPVWTIDDNAHPVITDLSEQLTAEQTFNYINVKGEGTSTTNPVSGTAFDDNPLSPTYILGDFGTHSVTITLSGLETNDQATAAAKAILAGSLSGSQVITVSMVPNPALEPGDLVLLDLEDTDMSGVFLVNGMTWSPSQAEPMQLICARQTAAA
jgi:uncharacterized membrane protein YgcG